MIDRMLIYQAQGSHTNYSISAKPIIKHMNAEQNELFITLTDTQNKHIKEINIAHNIRKK